MSRIRGRDTLPELAVRRTLHALGFRYRIAPIGLPGKPDLVFPIRRKALFIHGCFWHGHNCAHGRTRPTTSVEFWRKKLKDNRARDKRKRVELERLGYRVLEVWECEVKADTWLPKVLEFLK